MSSFNSLSLDPPLILFSIDRRALSLPLWQKAGGYAVNVLAHNQRAISNRFAKPGADKWKGVHFKKGLTDAPVFVGNAAVFECKPWAIHEAGDHLLFIAQVVRFQSETDREPLVFANGRYATLKPTENVAPLWPLDIHY
jgi:flavin reductase (DIM6/NTAB) family NADH-FMN oxidoreductase RutF